MAGVCTGGGQIVCALTSRVLLVFTSGEMDAGADAECQGIRTTGLHARMRVRARARGTTRMLPVQELCARVCARVSVKHVGV